MPLPASNNIYAGNGAAFNDPRSGDFATNAQSTLNRAQFWDYTNNIAPLQNKLIQFATDPNQVYSNMDEAGQAVRDRFQSAAGTTTRSLQQSGQTLTAEQRDKLNRDRSINATGAYIGARRVAKDQTEQAQRQALGDISRIGEAQLQSASAGISANAGIDTQRNIQNQAAGNAWIGAVGQLVGSGAAAAARFA